MTERLTKSWAIHWSEEYVTQYTEIDIAHKEIIEDVTKLYEMCQDSLKYKDQIKNLAKKIEQNMLNHMQIEIDHLKKSNMPEWFSHENSHDKYIQKMILYNRYQMADLIRGLLIAEVALDYMKEHFFVFDMRDLPKIIAKKKKTDQAAN